MSNGCCRACRKALVSSSETTPATSWLRSAASQRSIVLSVNARAVVTDCGASAGVRVATFGSARGRSRDWPAAADHVSLASEAISMADCNHGQSVAFTGASWAGGVVIAGPKGQLVTDDKHEGQESDRIAHILPHAQGRRKRHLHVHLHLFSSHLLALCCHRSCKCTCICNVKGRDLAGQGASMQITNGMKAGDLGPVEWRKSSASNPSGNCVEAAALPDGSVALRNSREPGRRCACLHQGRDCCFPGRRQEWRVRRPGLTITT